MSDDLVKMARLAQHDERMSSGALYGNLADRIEELEANINLKADFIDATLNQLAASDQRIEELERMLGLADDQRREWERHCKAAEAQLAKAVEALEKVSSMACMGSGIALGRMLKSDANAGDPWADELSARVEFALSTIAELKGEKID